jgi:hypothetical protein
MLGRTSLFLYSPTLELRPNLLRHLQVSLVLKSSGLCLQRFSLMLFHRVWRTWRSRDPDQLHDGTTGAVDLTPNGLVLQLASERRFRRDMRPVGVAVAYPRFPEDVLQLVDCGPIAQRQDGSARDMPVGGGDDLPRRLVSR